MGNVVVRREPRARGKATKERHALILEEGMSAPDFELPDAAGTPVKLSALKGRLIVVYFYPKDDTSGCTAEAKDFTRMAGEFAQAGADVLGISPDSPASHRKFKEKHDLGVRLLADEARAPPAFRAAVVHVLLLNCHPFTDGNGRVARILLNHVLKQGGMPDGVYLPLYEVANRFMGGYEIALRFAEIRGDWEPFLQYLLDAIRCYREITVDRSSSGGTGQDRVVHAPLCDA